MGPRLRGENQSIKVEGRGRTNLLSSQGNLQRILESLRIAKEKGATLRVGPELEITYALRRSRLRINLKGVFQRVWLHGPLPRRYFQQNVLNQTMCIHFGCFLGDTCLHSWEVLAEILKSEEAKGIVCDIGMSAGLPYSI